MHVESIAVSQLQPAPYNPRRPLRPGDPGWEKLRRSLLEFDLVQPIVWNRRSGFVVGGHQRLEILKAEGREVVDCVVVDLPPERERALNLTLNNEFVGSRWDPDKLVGLLTDLQDTPDFDATLTGFDEQQLKDLLFIPDPAALEVSEEEDDLHQITATLCIPEDRWSSIQPRLDLLLAEEPSVRGHFKLPPSER
ncbi:MAG: ParB N-terminal domain-containing protein [Planctomycetaceae bacterium]|nr:ParB N-terminal domain-containing protein [Planctomycetaceae bacterium]